jgi:large subunit ribosomal protein L29
MRAEDIRELNDDEIRSRIAELTDERFRLRFRSATQTLEDPLRLRTIRKDVARMQTILRERALGVGRGAPAAAAEGARGAKKGATRKSTGTRAARARGK